MVTEIPPGSSVIPGGLLEYDQVLVEVPRSSAAKGIRLGIGLGLSVVLGLRVRLRHIHRLVRRLRS